MMRSPFAWLGLSSLLAVSLPGSPGHAQSAPAAPSAAPAVQPAPAGEPLDLTGETATTQAAPPPAPIAPEAAPPVLAAPVAAAPEPKPAPRLRSNAINLSVLGFVIGNIRLNYERMLSEKHGVFAEALVAPDFLNGCDFVGYGAAMGYRYHWRGAGTSGFVGGTVGFMRGSGTRATLKFGETDPVDFTGSIWTIGIGPHVGKRWLFEPSGVNLTVRFGGGFAYNMANPSPGTPAQATHNVEHSYVLLDGELSVGYSF